MKKLISVILSLSVIAAMFSGMSVVSSAREDGHSHTACAAEALPSQKDDTVTTAIYINPLYKDVISEEEIQSLQNALNMPPSETNAAASDYVSSIDAAGAIMRENMKNRVASFTIYYKTTVKPTQQLFYDIADVAFMHTGVPTEGDYLLWQYGGWSGKLSPSSRGNEYYCDVTFNLTYYTTRAQEAAVDTAIEKLLRSELANCRTDYEKVCAIYDYMCSNIVYDYKNLNDDTYKLKYTAYAALINKTSVCQGYALLFYRLALTLGVDARIITGIGNGGAHGWNIVKLRGKYYNLDSTWDAGVKSYSYFLKCNAHFTDHLRDAEYNTPEFNKEYPMATEDYTNTPCTGSHRQSDPVIENVTAASCTEDGSYETVIYCLDCGIEVRRTKVTVPGGHKWNKDERTEPTCTESGIIWHTCSVCGVKETVSVIPAKGHKWSAWKVIKEATERENGLKQRNCTVCGEKETELIPRTGGIIGDINMDGEVNGIDSGLLLQLIAGWDVTGIDEAAADVNGDGQIDGVDSGLMLQYLAFWFSEFPTA